jgi:hypothetical protein
VRATGEAARSRSKAPAERSVDRLAAPSPGPVHAHLLALQRTAGNRAAAEAAARLDRWPWSKKKPLGERLGKLSEAQLKKLNDTCWVAALQALVFAGALSQQALDKWRQNRDTFRERLYEYGLPKIINRTHTLAGTPDIPENTIVGFFRRNHPDDAAPTRLSHVVLSLGGGRLAGAKNEALRTGYSNAWTTEVDLATILDWETGGLPQIVPTEEERQRNLPPSMLEREVRYRPIKELEASIKQASAPDA